MAISRADELIRSLMDYLNLSDDNQQVQFFRSWSSIVGIDLAAHSRVADLKKGAVIVEVDHPGWLQRIQINQTSIIKKIQRDFPELEIKRLFLRYRDRSKWSVAKNPAPDVPDTTERAQAASSESKTQIDAPDAPVLPDDDLRNALSRLKSSIEERSTESNS